MPQDEWRAVLSRVASGDLGVPEALARLDESHMANLGYAQVDLERRQRCGFPEVIFCQGKTCEWVSGVVQRLAGAGQDCLATRVSMEQADHLARLFPTAEQDHVARTFWLPSGPRPTPIGRVAILTAGTSDLPVAREAMVTARALGCETTLTADVGVAGIHRLLRHRSSFDHAHAVVVVAGMDGALPSVVGGLVACPVIAVPTSVGYGAALGGIAALLTMLNSCSASVAVVNIDSGFKGGYVAALIARQAGIHEDRAETQSPTGRSKTPGRRRRAKGARQAKSNRSAE